MSCKAAGVSGRDFVLVLRAASDRFVLYLADGFGLRRGSFFFKENGFYINGFHIILHGVGGFFCLRNLSSRGSLLGRDYRFFALFFSLTWQEIVFSLCSKMMKKHFLTRSCLTRRKIYLRRDVYGRRARLRLLRRILRRARAVGAGGGRRVVRLFVCLFCLK